MASVNREELLRAAYEAGRLVLHYYAGPSSCISLKADGSPVTEADLAAHTYLCKALAQLKPIPILSEEDTVPYEVRRDWREFWLIDPLDGTKDFLAGTGEFTINIALIEEGKPVQSVLYAPVFQETYFAERGEGAYWRNTTGTHRLPLHPSPPWSACRSRFSTTPEMESFLARNGLTNTPTVGAALKFARVAEGRVGLYPRFVPAHEWDIAAGHLIVTEAGGFIRDLVTQSEPRYNNPTTRSNAFVAGASPLLDRIQWG